MPDGCLRARGCEGRHAVDRDGRQGAAARMKKPADVRHHPRDHSWRGASSGSAAGSDLISILVNPRDESVWHPIGRARERYPQRIPLPISAFHPAKINGSRRGTSRPDGASVFRRRWGGIVIAAERAEVQADADQRRRPQQAKLQRRPRQTRSSRHLPVLPGCSSSLPLTSCPSGDPNLGNHHLLLHLGNLPFDSASFRCTDWRRASSRALTVSPLAASIPNS